MSDTQQKIIINRDLFPGNVCFGCGADNPQGLHIEIFQGEENKDRLLGIFKPTPHMIGFPGITHGGVIYSALDCLGAWVPTILRKATKAIWILRSASMTYHKAAPESADLHLMGMIEQAGKEWEAITVHTEARNSKGDLLAEGKFKVIPLPVEKFKKVAGIEKLPENWEKLLGEN